jgi:fibronectin-binding autotransporter adhesin
VQTAGALQAGTNAAFGTGRLALSGGRVSSDSTAARVFGNAVELSGALALGDAINSGALTLSGAVTLGNGASLSVVSSATLSGVVGGTNGFTKTGAAELILSGANVFTGAASVNQGVLTLAGGSAIADSVPLNVAGGATLKLASSERIESLTGGGLVNLQGSTLTISGSAASVVGGVVSGSGALVKAGSSNLTLSAANTFTGGVDLQRAVNLPTTQRWRVHSRMLRFSPVR